MIHCHSPATLAPVCWLSMERDVVCNTPCMVASLVTRHLCDCHLCHFAHTPHNVCSSLRAMEWYECTMHIMCIHFVVTPLVCVHQEWCVLEHEVRVVEQSICVSRRWCWLCLQPVITTWNDAASSCEESLEPLESLRDGIVRICPSEPFESTNDLLSIVCV